MVNGTKLRTIRQLKGYSQEYVAGKLGMSQTNYSNIESGKTEIKMEVLEKFAVLHEIDTADILSFGEHYIFNNNNQQGGHASSNAHHHYYSDKICEIYEKQIKWLKAELEKLRAELKTKRQRPNTDTDH